MTPLYPTSTPKGRSSFSAPGKSLSHDAAQSKGCQDNLDPPATYSPMLPPKCSRSFSKQKCCDLDTSTCDMRQCKPTLIFYRQRGGSHSKKKLICWRSSFPGPTELSQLLPQGCAGLSCSCSSVLPATGAAGRLGQPPGVPVPRALPSQPCLQAAAAPSESDGKRDDFL